VEVRKIDSLGSHHQSISVSELRLTQNVIISQSYAQCTASDLTTCFRQYRFGQFRPVSSADLVNGGHSESIGRLRRQVSRESVRRGRLLDLLRVVSVGAGAGQAVPDDVAVDRVSAVVDGRRPLQTDRGSVHLGGKRTARLTGRTSCTYAPDRRPTQAKL